MAANAFFASTIILMSLGLFLLQECQFLIPYRRLLFEKYLGAIGWFALVLFVNIFAAVHAICRKAFLKDTGRKLAHVEKQLRTGVTISEELSEHLKE